MLKKSTSHVFWFFMTVIACALGGPVLAILPIICWLCAASRTKKHNEAIDAQRHQELLMMTRSRA